MVDDSLVNHGDEFAFDSTEMGSAYADLCHKSHGVTSGTGTTEFKF